MITIVSIGHTDKAFVYVTVEPKQGEVRATYLRTVRCARHGTARHGTADQEAKWNVLTSLTGASSVHGPDGESVRAVLTLQRL